MSQVDQEIAIIVSVIIILITLAVILILFAAYYSTSKKGLLKEKEVLKATYEKTILQTQLEVQEQTMQTIGADLHDNIGQLLSLTSLTLNSIEIENRLKSQQKIEAAIDLTMRSIKEMRLLGKLLQGDQLIVLGLSEAIQHQVSWLERSGQYEISYVQESEMPAANNPNKDLILFRMVQEVLNNIIKHARATRINIKLDYLEKAILLHIEDNGVGFDPEELSADKKGMGLLNINKRAAIVGGEVGITSKPGEGTVILIFIPYP
ncbi:ATP-binding protein [uncultured Mucilaginibacter sp.]|uniref:sensor histidine kinase n=1 Tax=uncultured Mucilaginibacter sp. TaxID=797541 RepID=UPI0025E6DB89|nr:ATP-binding protein [uncultured Mucilaginibacter sp.]